MNVSFFYLYIVLCNIFKFRKKLLLLYYIYLYISKEHIIKEIKFLRFFSYFFVNLNEVSENYEIPENL